MNFRAAAPPTAPPQSALQKRLSVRRRLVPAVWRRRRPGLRVVPHHRAGPRVGTSPFLQQLGSRLDFPALVTLAGAWFAWQAFGAGAVPTSLLPDLVSSLGRAAPSSLPPLLDRLTADLNLLVE